MSDFRNSRLTAISDEQFQENRAYAESQIALFYPRIMQACSRRAAYRMKQQFTGYTERSCMEEQGSEWRVIFGMMLEIYCLACISAQIRFSNRATRAKFTKAIFDEKLRICGLTDPQFIETIHKDLEKVGITA